ncbi:hypothetical protein A2382_01230 [Candidatus Woesebacteria bacterium RIFOXYB1_FULL_38_16]|uniref:DUF3048 domain-containing protein n=1 Tax=Candidatus Woesebacteria bacterium RIFOXYB1_FULL_38_16 TaxID=1802538 RepID=A0A1F8CRZ7_9BACT|nr:MAG: hypothetical protein A2382_01230 [Candidatus Woesebacteria bacterium RIFOXYB1_FULL_38_16]
MKKFIDSKKIMWLFGFLGLFMISTGTSWMIFSYLLKSDSVETTAVTGTRLEKQRAKIAELPKTEECPINGQMFSKVEKEIWEGRRPLTAVVENHLDARPQSGLSAADVVYEFVAEGGITRFLSIFHCAASGQDLKIAPVRSARFYFVNLASEYGADPIFLHIGGANNICNDCPGGVKPRGTVDPKVNVYALLTKIGWMRGQYGNDFNGEQNVGYPVVMRDRNRLSDDTEAAWEHSLVAFIDKVHDEAAKRGFGALDEKGESWDSEFEKWKFIDGKALSSPKASEISFMFWENKPEYDVKWTYDSSTNSYKRTNGDKPFVDWEFKNKQIEAKNVVIQFVAETGPVDKEFHMYYEVVGNGRALVFQNGDVIEGTWKKPSRTERTIFYDNAGREISFVRGLIWIEGMPKANDIEY